MITYGMAALTALGCMVLAIFATVMVMSLMAAARASDEHTDYSNAALAEARDQGYAEAEADMLSARVKRENALTLKAVRDTRASMAQEIQMLADAKFEQGWAAAMASIKAAS